MAVRAFAALILGPPVLLAFYLGFPFADLLVAAVAAIAAWEWLRLCQDGDISAAGWLATALVPLAVLTGRFTELWPLAVLCGLAAVAAAALAGRLRANVLLTLAGPAYVMAAGFSILLVRDGVPATTSSGTAVGQAGGDGLALLLWLLLTVWATDIFAYFAGKSLGGPKLAPRLSPKKTWSGLGGGTIAAAAVGLAFAYVLEAPGGWALPMLIGALLALLAQAGDLMESSLKRRFAVKDSSNLIPGHGGVLDRIDGLMPASIAVAILVWFGGAPF